MADGPDGPLPSPEAVAKAAGIGEAEVLLGWVIREPPWLGATSFPVRTFMTGLGTRAAVADGRVRTFPARLSAVPGLLSGRMTPDVFVVGAHASQSGFVLANSPGYVATALRHAGSVVVELWPGYPVPGAQLLDGNIVAVVERPGPPDPLPDNLVSPAHRQIADLVAGLIPADATIQWGPGAIGASVVGSIRRPVRVRSGLVTEELVLLAEAGLLEPPAEAAYLWGGPALHAMVRDGRLRLRGVETTHDLSLISSIEGFVAINTALQVGLDGAANVETVQGRVVSGAGGHPDFAAGASRSPGGLSIVALPATVGDRSTIVAAPETVTTPRSDVDVVVTEFGVADLRGLDDRDRARRIIGIAGPEHRDRLRAESLRG